MITPSLPAEGIVSGVQCTNMSTKGQDPTKPFIPEQEVVCFSVRVERK